MNKVKFGFQHIGKPTPEWAKLTFRIIVLLSSAATIVIANTHLMSDDTKVEVNVWMAAFNALALGISQMFGIEYKSPMEAIKSPKKR